MKKIIIPITTSLFAAAAALAADITLSESTQLAVNRTDTNYIVDKDNITITHSNNNGARHPTNTVIFQLGSHKGITLTSKDVIPEANNNLPFFGLCGIQFAGDGASVSDITLSPTEGATPIAIMGNNNSTNKDYTTAFTVDNTTFNYNMGENSVLTGRANVRVINGGVLNWNTSLAKQWDSTNKVYLTGDSKIYGIKFSADTAGNGTVNLGKASAETDADGNDSFFNTNFENVNVNFDSAFTNNVVFNYNDDATMNNTVFNQNGKVITVKTSKTFSATGATFSDGLNVSADSTIDIRASSLTYGAGSFELSTSASFMASTLNGVNTRFYGAGRDSTIIAIKGSSLVGNFVGENATFQIYAPSSADFSMSNIKNATVEFKSDFAKTAGDFGSAAGLKVVADNNVNVSVVGRFSGNLADLVLREGASFTTNAYAPTGTGGNNIIGSIDVAKGAKMQIAGGLRTHGYADGAIIINGTGSTLVNYQNTMDSFIYGMNGNTTFGANATVSQKAQTIDSGSYEVKNWVGSNNAITLTSNAAKDALQFGNKLYIGNGVNVVLNSTDAFNIEGKSQAESTFTFERSLNMFGSLVDNTMVSGFTINALNNIGSIALLDEGNSTLEFAFGADGVLILGESASLNAIETSLSDYTLIIHGEIANQFKIFDLTEEEILAHVKVDDGKTLQIVDAGNGAYWLNVIPEPSTYAAILGGLAIAFAFMRKTRKGA